MVSKEKKPTNSGASFRATCRATLSSSSLEGLMDTLAFLGMGWRERVGSPRLSVSHRPDATVPWWGREGRAAIEQRRQAPPDRPNVCLVPYRKFRRPGLPALVKDS